MNALYPNILTISGFDPCGGAGLIADIKTLNSLGCRALGIISCQTIQNDSRVSQCIASDPQLVGSQIDDLTENYRIDAIKIGLLPDTKLIRLIAEKIDRIRQKNLTPVVLDPVITSSSGYSFCDAEVVASLVQHLLPFVTLATPNLSEAKQLAGNITPASAIAKKLLNGGCQSLLITTEEESDDRLTHRLYQPNTPPIAIDCERLNVCYHGSGCILASSIAAHLAHGDALNEAVHKANDFTYNHLRNTVNSNSR